MIDLPFKLSELRKPYLQQVRPAYSDFILFYLLQVWTQILLAYFTIIFIFTIEERKLYFQQRIFIISSLFYSASVLKFTYAPTIDYFFILTNDLSSLKQQRIKKAALFNGSLILVLNCINFFFIWNCCKCRKKSSHVKKCVRIQNEEFPQFIYQDPQLYTRILTQPLLLSNHISKKFGNCRHRVTALTNTSLPFSRGRIHVLFGPNGSGKSSLQKILAQHDTATSGQIHYYQERMPVISYYNNYKSAVPFYSLDTAIRINNILNKRKSAQNSKLVQMILKIRSKLSQDSLLLPILYSLSNDGDLIIMDEPFTYLNQQEQIKLTKILISAAQNGKCVIVATHKLNWIQKNADCLALFANCGDIWFYGSINFFVERFKEERDSYKIYQLQIKDLEERNLILQRIKKFKRISVNPLIEDNLIQFRAQQSEFNKLKHYIRNYQIKRDDIQSTIREGLENIQDIQQNPQNDEGFTDFYKNQKFTFQRFDQWRNQIR